MSSHASPLQSEGVLRTTRVAQRRSRLRISRGAGARQPVVVRVSASALLWAYEKHTAALCSAVENWRDLKLWGQLSAVRRHEIELCRDANRVRVEWSDESGASTAPFTLSVLLVHDPARSLVLDFGADRDTARDWLVRLQLMTLPWAQLMSQSSVSSMPTRQRTALETALGLGAHQAAVGAPPVTGDASDQPESSEPSDVPQNAIDVLHARLLTTSELVQTGVEWVTGVLEALDLTVETFDNVCSKLPLVGAAVQLTCLALSTLSTLYATRAERRLVEQVRIRLNRISTRVLLEMLQACSSSSLDDTEYVQSLESVMIELECSHYALDRYVIAGIISRAWSGPVPSNIQERLKQIETSLVDLRNLHTTLHTATNVTHIRRQVDDTATDVARIRRQMDHFIITANETSAALTDAFKPVFQIAHRVDLDRMPVVIEACPLFANVKDALTASKLKNNNRDVLIHGEGGIGKTVTCCILVADRDIQEQFYDGCFWLQLGKGVSEAQVVADISRKVRRFGGAKLGQQIEEIAKAKDALQEAVEMVGEFFRDRHMLLLLDNMWLRPPEKKSWYEQLSRLVPGPNSTVVVSSRQRKVCENYALQTFSVAPLQIDGEERQCRAATILFDHFFRLTVGETGHMQDMEDLQFVEQRAELLKLTCGIHILIEMVAKHVANRRVWRNETLQSAKKRLKDRILNLSTRGYYESPHMAAIISESLEQIDAIASTDSLGFIDEIRRNREPNFFSRSYEALCIAPVERAAVPLSVLQLLWNLSSYDEALAVAEEFEGAAIARIEDAEYGTYVGYELVLHDLQRAFCEEVASRNNRIDRHHENLLYGFCSKRNVSVSDPGYDWALDCFPEEVSEQIVRERGHYMARHLVRHMVAAEGKTGGKGIKTILRGVLSDFRWISKRGSLFGRNGLLRDLNVAAPQLAIYDSISAESRGAPGSTGIESINWTDAEIEFLVLLRRIIMSISPDDYQGVDGHFASSTATSLYTRIAAAKDWIRGNETEGVVDVETNDVPFSVYKGLADMTESIVKNVRNVWLFPVTVYSEAPQVMDSRMELELAISDSAVRCVTVLASGYHVVTGCVDGKIRVHDITTGETIGTFSEHDGAVLCVTSTNRDVDDQGQYVLSSSVDGSVEVWRVDGEFRPTLRFVQRLTVPGEPIDEVDSRQQSVHAGITKDGRLVAAYKRSQVHLWKRSLDSPSEYEYKYALPEELRMTAVGLAVSDDGSFIACFGFGAPQLAEWKLRKTEPDGGENWSSRLISVPRSLSETYSLALSYIGDEPSKETKLCWFGGRHSLFVHDVSGNEEENLHEVGIFNRKGVTSISVLSHGQDWRHCEILLGHQDGSITRHQSLLHDCNESYGKRTPSGSNGVKCMAVLPSADERNGRPSRFLTGHENGRLRVWRFEYRPQRLSSFPVPFDYSMVSPSGGTVEAIVCLAGTATPAGTIILSGSARGVLSLWKANSGEHLASRRIPMTRSRMSGKRLFVEISAVDLSYVNGRIVALSGASDYKLWTWDVSRNVMCAVRMPQEEQWSMGPGVTEYGVTTGFSMTLMSSDGCRIVVALTDGDIRIYESREGIWDGSVSVSCVYSSLGLTDVRFEHVLAFHSTMNFLSMAVSANGTCYVLMDHRGICLFVNAINPACGAFGWKNKVRERDRVIPSCIPQSGTNSGGPWRESSVSRKYIETSLQKTFSGRSGTGVTVRCLPVGTLSTQRVNVFVNGDESVRVTTSVSLDSDVRDILLMKTEDDAGHEDIMLAFGLGNGHLPIFRLVT